MEAREGFDRLVAGFPDMIHSVDADGNIVFVNHMATDLLGYTADELRAMNIRQLYPPEILEAVEKGFRAVKQTGEMRVESQLMAKDGTRIPVELRTIAIHDAQGAFARTFTVARDLRPLKELQERLIHAGRLAAVGELAAGVVHDLNNPLTAIILASTVMDKLAGKARHWIVGDRNQIEQIFLNLFANACDAMEQSGVRELTVDVSPFPEDAPQVWCCTVRDTGGGMSPDVQERAFQSFFTTKPRGKGTGLGLSISRAIAKEHGGDIQLASEPGRGTTFSILLPQHQRSSS
jgi:PAS domain S-box-containing protein